MDVTYAVVNKARRGGGASGRDPAPYGRDSAPYGYDPAPYGRDSASSGRDPAPPGPCTHPPSPLRRPSPTASPQPGDAAYEVVTPQGDPGSSARLGFNFRIGKPKGPREPPADWARA
ncbi:tyrosine-protein phosphatase non-receptor type 18 [Grus japonensis]|uniref:Tyrosine-protein phosphatase non-receptor type 18 n=1 Tax=Grus japonensis TaxID=30415 RepID=A0ABC9Y0N7_GRUJA